MLKDSDEASQSANVYLSTVLGRLRHDQRLLLMHGDHAALAAGRSSTGADDAIDGSRARTGAGNLDYYNDHQSVTDQIGKKVGRRRDWAAPSLWIN